MVDYLRTVRKLVGSSLIQQPGLCPLIFNEDGQILLQRRRDTPLWRLPAGAVEINESSLDARKREVAEETSLRVLKA